VSISAARSVRYGAGSGLAVDIPATP